MYRLFFVLISLLVSQAFAADVANLYQSQLPVSSQAEQERKTVAPEILQQVILKVVGDRAVLDKVDITPLLAQTDQLIKQYQYHRTNTISDDLTQPDRLEAVLSFDKLQLNESLTAIGLPIWGNNRPEVLIWLAVEANKKRTILSADQTNLAIIQVIDAAADRRGMSVLLPVMDLEDQTQVNFTDLWADFSETVEAASQRYGSAVILMVKIRVSEQGLHQVDWHARINGESEQWQSRGDVQIAMQDGIDELTDRLARRFSQFEVNQTENSFSLQITDVQNYSDYARIKQYLTDLQNVSALKFSNLSDHTLTVDLTFNGDITLFDRTLAIDRLLVKQSSYSAIDVKSYRLSL